MTLRVLTIIVTIAMAIVVGSLSFVVLVLSDRDRGAMNDVFAAGLGIGYVIPAAGAALMVIVLVTILLARRSASLGKIFGFSSVAVFATLLGLGSLVASYVEFALLGIAIAVAGAASVWAAIRAMRQGAV